MRTLFFLLLMAASSLPVSAQKKPGTSSVKPQKSDYVVTIATVDGAIDLILYDATPLHKENFLKLTGAKFYDGCTFHRVINNFMIQGGDPESKPAGTPAKIGNGGPGYTLPAEIVPGLTHTAGKLAAARMGDNVNPKRESSGSQFYIVQNKSGTPHLDGQYTVFGEVLKGMEVVNAIAIRNQPSGGMVVTARKMKRKEISKQYGYTYPQ